MKKVNLVMSGCGSIAVKRHAPECLASDKVNVLGFFDVNLERAKETAGQFQ